MNHQENVSMVECGSGQRKEDGSACEIQELQNMFLEKSDVL